MAGNNVLRGAPGREDDNTSLQDSFHPGHLRSVAMSNGPANAASESRISTGAQMASVDNIQQHLSQSREPALNEEGGEMDQFAAPSPPSSVTVGSAESTAAAPAARPLNAVAAVAPAPAPAARPPNAAAAVAPAPAAALGSSVVDDYDDFPRPVSCISSMIDRGDVESKRLFLARRTVLEMLRDRGYSVQEHELARTLPEFRAWWAERPELERLSITTTLVSDHSNKVVFLTVFWPSMIMDKHLPRIDRSGSSGCAELCVVDRLKVIFCPPEPVKKATIREIYSGIKDENLSRLILVLQGKIMSQARESLKDIFSFKVDTFQITELLVNNTKHVLKPKHEVLTEEEKTKLLKEYNVQESQLPRMLESDAVARYYGLGKGTVVKVIYDSELTGNHVTYRCIF
ncbi:hypothetical protein EJB05_29622 [Eragrostis curvula]|uniref:RNA polymerase subunit H/Rpb5 C-terminal domain-containing protein n=1 Tax=Eragrostis curvula TaxID=38414 RepID=A0A5J9UUI2_9POAL|nr:hypothetical protein EJB05_29622 [Eragrostis curvula]